MIDARSMTGEHPIRRIARVAALGLSLTVWSLSGCIPLAERPLIAADESQPDPDLVGTWLMTIDNDQVRFDIIPRADGTLDAVSVTLDEDGPDEWSVYRLHAGRLDGHRLFSARMIASDNEAPDPGRPVHVLFRYRKQADGTVALWNLDEDRVAAAIEAGRLPGRVDRGRWATEIVITAEPERYRAFLRDGGIEALLSHPFGTLRRDPGASGTR